MDYSCTSNISVGMSMVTSYEFDGAGGISMVICAKAIGQLLCVAL